MFLYPHRLCTMFLHPHRLCTVSPSTHTGCIACFLLSFLLQLSNFRLNAFPQQIHILCFLYTVQQSCFPLSLLIFYRFITVFVLVLHSFSLWKRTHLYEQIQMYIHFYTIWKQKSETDCSLVVQNLPNIWTRPWVLFPFPHKSV